MRKSIIVASVVACMGFVVAGCSSNAGAAAIVNGVTYTEAQVDSFIEDMYVVENPSRAQALDALLRIDALERPIVEKHAEELPDEIKAEAYRSCADASGNEVTASSPQYRRIQCEFDYLKSVNPAVEDEFMDAFAQVDLKVNPRYANSEILGVSSKDRMQGN